MGKHRNRAQKISLLEPLEYRLLLAANLIANPAVVFPGIGFGNPDVVQNGFAVHGEMQLLQDANNGAAGAFDSPAGTVTVMWYGGSVVTTFTFTEHSDPDPWQSYSTAFDQDFFLNKADGGIKVTKGKYKGCYILYTVYSGDDVFAPTAPFTPDDYEALQNSQFPEKDQYFPILFRGEGLQLAVTAPPKTTATFDTISPIKLALRESNGKVNTTTVEHVTVSLDSSSTGLGTLHGTTARDTVQGVVTFDDLYINRPGKYKLRFTDDDGHEVTSIEFTVTALKLVFLKPIPTTEADTAVSPALQVAVKNSFGETVTSVNSGDITLNILGTNAGNPISGNVASIVNGVATFSNLTLKRPDFYTLTATDAEGDTPGKSNKFKITGDSLKFTKQPVKTDVDTAMVFTVKIYDSKGKVDTAVTTAAKISLNVISGGSNVTLSGTQTVNFVNGVAEFTVNQAVKLNAPGVYTFTAAEVDGGTPTEISKDAVSAKFTIVGYHLLAQVAALNVGENQNFTLTITVLNSKNQVVTTLDGSKLEITLTPKNLQSHGVLSTYTDPGFVNGADAVTGLSVSLRGAYLLSIVQVDNLDVAVPQTNPYTFKPLTVHV